MSDEHVSSHNADNVRGFRIVARELAISLVEHPESGLSDGSKTAGASQL